MLHRVENFLHKLSAFLILLVGALIFGNVLARSIAGTQIPDTIIIVPELMVAMVLLPLAAVTRDRSHIVVELVSRRMPERVQGWLVVIGSVIGLIAICILLYVGLQDLEKLIERQSRFAGDLSLPKWPGVAAYVAGMAFAAVRLLLMVVRDSSKCMRGELGELLETHDIGELAAVHDDTQDNKQKREV